MAQEQARIVLHQNIEASDTDLNVPFKFNAQAPEFIPQSHVQFTVPSYHHHPYLNVLSGGTETDWYYFIDKEPVHLLSGSLPNCSKTALTDETWKKIIKQVEYQFSDLSLLVNDSLMKQIHRDPEGYVPLSVVCASMKIKCLINNPSSVAQALQSSLMLVVSPDCKKVKRRKPLTEKAREELQSRVVIAENLPEDHSYKTLEKIFSSVQRIKTMRICHPHDSNSSKPKAEFLVSNKLHALVEYESVEIAEKAAEKLNDERNWREGLRVRLLVRRSPKSVMMNGRSEFDEILEEEEIMQSGSPECLLHLSKIELSPEMHAEDEGGGTGGGHRGWNRGRGNPSRGGRNGKGKCPSSLRIEQVKKPSAGPRMPDGTRGFTMGRGKVPQSHFPNSV